MQFPVPQITAFVLLMHLAFGCCMHHAHACEVNCCSEPAATAEACPCGTHRHAGESETPTHGVGTPDNHPRKHHCSGGHCTFLQSQRLAEQMGGFAADFRQLEAITTDGGIESFRSQLDRSQHQPIFLAGTSLRTHLALRVLLI